uniref:Uncharacterized protein n=1 Tax=Oryza sativa subsp. japonica TaxID=39947 RepID=Q6YXJ2_ORYSJ|nr:hypothetical protein [Oryza sativa Japonica Group]BAD31479.1 hypothetical protein [Oryza sativa Japonica Group]
MSAATSSPSLLLSLSPLSLTLIVWCSGQTGPPADGAMRERRSGGRRRRGGGGDGDGDDDAGAREQGGGGDGGVGAGELSPSSPRAQPRSCSSVDAATKGNPPRSARTTSAPGSLRLPEVAQRVVELLHHRHWWFGPWALGLGLSALGPHFEDDNRFNLKPIKIISVNEERKD